MNIISENISIRSMWFFNHKIQRPGMPCGVKSHYHFWLTCTYYFGHLILRKRAPFELKTIEL
jgi:hypothetical protein